MAQPDALEDRLRGLILGNAGANKQQQLPQPVSSMHSLPASYQLPTPATGLGMNPMVENQSSPQSSKPQEKQGYSAHKKLNQAQRRQMSSQLSIPIDPRPQPQGGGYQGFPRHLAARPHPQNVQSWQQQYQNHGPSPPQQQISPAYQNFSPNSPFDHRMQYPSQQGRSPIQPVYHMQPQNSWQSHQQFEPRSQPQHRQLYQPGPTLRGGDPRDVFDEHSVRAQSEFLDGLVHSHVNKIAIDDQEIREKEAFRVVLESACRAAVATYEINLGCQTFDATSIKLKCFGSMASGFATKASDMDLALLTPLSVPHPESSESPIPRILEKTLLDLGYGTRLLTRTRVPIIKVCERPTKKLMFDLQTERRLFEQGPTEESATVQNQEDAATVEDFEQKENGRSAEICPTTEEQAYEKQLSSLNQKHNQSLGVYYGLAKRVLYKLGGQDIGLSGTIGTGALSTDKLKILNDVSKAFIRGLLDEDLKLALLTINESSFESSPVSLSGVYSQAEIERLAAKWPSRQIREKSESKEEECYRTVMEWNQLKWQAPGNPQYQNRQLYSLLDRMKRIHTLQFATLVQAPHEDAQAYYNRMNRLLEEPENNPSLLPVIFSQYVDGVSDPLIQKRLSFLITGPGKEQMGQKALLFHHEILQLTKEYEQGLAEDLYEAEDRADVEAYVSLLRAPNNMNWTETENYFNGLSESREAIELITKIKKLREPSSSGTRDRYHDHLAFPPDDSVGIQCDINFSADLALQNTHLLRCYYAADPRVRPLVLFVKSWASRRGINTPFRGTLSSYGYVLMVLHYLVNIAKPFVLPNLQLLRRPPPPHLSPAEAAVWDTCKGLDVGFWRDEQEIKALAAKKQLNNNHDSVGKLLRGFFLYFANANPGGRPGFDWGREVLSLRTQGGIISKAEKGWVGARTTTETITTSHANPAALNGSASKSPESTISKTVKVEEIKEVRHRYLFAIEDPFEIDHNVARTVGHDGIVKIRDEFRRAWRIIKDRGAKGKDVDLLLVSENPQDGRSGGYQQKQKAALMDKIIMGGLAGVVARGGTVAGYMAKGGSIGGGGGGGDGVAMGRSGSGDAVAAVPGVQIGDGVQGMRPTER